MENFFIEIREINFFVDNFCLRVTIDPECLSLAERLAAFRGGHAGRPGGNGLNGWRTVPRRRGSGVSARETRGKARGMETTARERERGER